MRTFELPAAVTVQLRTWAGIPGRATEKGYEGPPLALEVRTFARHKNDYYLGPFFSEGDRVHITREQLELSVRAHLDMGLMDYVDIRDGFGLVEISYWSPDEVRRAIEYRGPEVERGAFYSEYEARLWSTPSQYVALLQASANLRLPPPIRAGGFVIRDEWDGRQPTYDYVYRLQPLVGSQ